jgi:hypothetical protein
MRNYILIMMCCGLLLAAGCKKNQLGGKSSVSGTVTHHEKLIPFSRVFVKFNAKEFPGSDTTKYDHRIETGADGKYTFSCYKGDYYLYGKGFDTGISEVVTGGIHVKVRSNENVDATVHVTED